MFGELEDTRKMLEHSLERYLEACAAARLHTNRPLFSHTQEHSTRMATEMSAIVACEEKIGRAKKIISQTINHSPFVARINVLPDEVLVRIFHIALGLQPCFADIDDQGIQDDRTQDAFDQVPESLSHVCTRWRRVAFGAPTLWRHIDIDTDATDVLSCANARLTRTGRLLLDVHIIGALFDSEELKQWIASAAPRMRSLTLIMTDELKTHESLLASCFRHCLPGTLTHLTIWKEGAVGSDESSIILHLGDPSDYFAQSEFSDVYNRLTSLRLRQVYPYWTSPVYHGLSELYLASHQVSQSQLLGISASQLALILQSSPKLRVLRFDLTVSEGWQGVKTPPLPIHLVDLEILDLSTESRQPNIYQLELILPLFAPGTKPLQLTIDDLDEDRHLLLESVVQEFFARSNVSSLKLVYEGADYKELDFELLSRLAPQLQYFVLEGYQWGEYRGDYIGAYPRFHDRDNSAPNSRVEHLYLHRCELDLKWCPKLLSDLTHPPRVLILWRCRFVEDGEEVFDEEKIWCAFQGVSQDVRTLEWHVPMPSEDWFSGGMPRLY